MAQPRVLISGAGVAGAALAWWLNRVGVSVTIVEQSPVPRTSGQAVDIRGAAVEVIRKMGIVEIVQSKHTTEEGVAFVGSDGRELALFEATNDPDAQSVTSEFEIFRGDLARLLYDLTKDSTEYVFGNSISNIEDTSEGALVSFTNRNRSSVVYDLVVGADGLGSNVRKLMVGEVASKKAIRSLGQHMAYFTAKEDLLEGSKIAKWYNAPGGRCIFLRPDPAENSSRPILAVVSDDAEFYDVDGSSTGPQRDLIKRTFSDAGWVSSQILRHLDNADDFYYQHIAQVKMEKWARGRVVLVGDAGYCPSPVSGMGTSLALVGAYVLAREIANHYSSCTPDEQRLPPDTALQVYERQMRPYVERGQKLIPGAPAIANPQTAFGITVLNKVVGFVSWSRLDRLMGRLVPALATVDDFKLPEYNWTKS